MGAATWNQTNTMRQDRMTCLGLHNAETDAVNPITAFWKLSALLDNGPFNYICRPFSFRCSRKDRAWHLGQLDRFFGFLWGYPRPFSQEQPPMYLLNLDDFYISSPTSLGMDAASAYALVVALLVLDV